MILPDAAVYKDVNASMMSSFPVVMTKQIENYLHLMDCKLESKFELMYNERYLRCLRLAEAKENGKELKFLRAVVWAEMRTNVTYTVDIRLNDLGTIEEAQCECGAGQGPSAHCKHVICVLIGSREFRRTGSVLTEVTCTSKLQTFHRAKSYKASPMKMGTLHELRQNMPGLRYDPRPEKYRKMDTESRVRNIVLNTLLPKKIPLYQLYPPANPYAIVKDHDYLTIDDERRFLLDNNLLTITQSECDVIEEMTRGQNKNPKWFEARKLRITASNYGTICRAVRRDMDTLANTLVSPKSLKTPAIRHGQKYETEAIKKFELQRKTEVKTCGLFISVEYPFLGASPDGIIDESSCIEVKCPFSCKNKLINPVTIPYLYLDPHNNLQLKKNHFYFYQIQGQLFCSGRKKCYFIIYSLVDIKVIEIQKDDDFIKDMVESLTSFYESHFRTAMLEKFLYRSYSSHFID